MSIKVAINGFGRIGRLFYRSLLEKNMLNDKIEVVVINDLVPAESLAYLLKYDSVHGTLDKEVKATNDSTIKVGERTVKTIMLKNTPDQLPWKDYGIDIVVESTGLFTKKADAMGHIQAGAKKVVISANSEEDVKTIIMGVNDGSYEGESIVSNASCTTNCVAPICYVLLKEGIGISEALMATNHSYTASQSIVDGPSKKDFREGRAGALNIAPAQTGAAKAVAWVLPQLKGKINGMAFRIPSPDVSVIDLTFRSERETSLDEINKLIKRASKTYLKGILDFTDQPLVSSDFRHNSNSSIYDILASMQLNSRFFKLVSWYDNEWGYSCRLAELVNKVKDYV